MWRGLWRSKQFEADMQEEMRFHLQQEADRLARVHGLNPEEARRQAFVRFGGVEIYKEEVREAPTAYRPAAPGDVHPAVVSLRFGGPIPAGISERLRAIGAQIDPALQLRRVVPLSDFYDELRYAWRMIAWAAGIITIAVLLLSAAGMHALMSFTIAQRTREIGIRSALGAQPRQLLLGVFGRAMGQLSIGLAVGPLISIAAFSAAGIGLGRGAALLVTVAAVITIVAAFAALGPARRSLRLPTVDALRADG